MKQTIQTQDICSQLHRINDYIRWAASVFVEQQLYFGHGNASAIDEAAYLVLSSLQLPNDLPAVYLDGHLLLAEKQKVINLVLQRVNTRLPAAYLTHEAFFAGLSFYVDERVLVPRSPIAELISSQFNPWVDADNVYNILDLCTGSGCIAIACAYAFLQAEIDAIDLSADALEVAKINVDKHDAQQRVNLIQSDLFSTLQTAENVAEYQHKYDIIVSNPPYVDQEDMNGLPKEFLAEPELGLAAGLDGLDLVIPMLQQAKNYLTPQGILVVEVGNSQYALAAKYPEIPFYWLDFEHGGQGVFILTAEQLQTYDF